MVLNKPGASNRERRFTTELPNLDDFGFFIPIYPETPFPRQYWHLWIFTSEAFDHLLYWNFRPRE